jgi:hypothetical protein
MSNAFANYRHIAWSASGKVETGFPGRSTITQKARANPRFNEKPKGSSVKCDPAQPISKIKDPVLISTGSLDATRQGTLLQAWRQDLGEIAVAG